MKTILVKTGKAGEGEDKKFFDAKADYEAADLYEAAELIKSLG
jgi:hypothetical protein